MIAYHYPKNGCKPGQGTLLYNEEMLGRVRERLASRWRLIGPTALVVAVLVYFAWQFGVSFQKQKMREYLKTVEPAIGAMRELPGGGRSNEQLTALVTQTDMRFRTERAKKLLDKTFPPSSLTHTHRELVSLAHDYFGVMSVLATMESNSGLVTSMQFDPPQYILGSENSAQSYQAISNVTKRAYNRRANAMVSRIGGLERRKFISAEEAGKANTLLVDDLRQIAAIWTELARAGREANAGAWEALSKHEENLHLKYDGDKYALYAEMEINRRLDELQGREDKLLKSIRILTRLYRLEN